MSWRNPNWKYVPSTSTNILPTLKRAGFRPTTEAERRARQVRLYGDPKGRAEPPDEQPVVEQTDTAKRKVRSALRLASAKR